MTKKKITSETDWNRVINMTDEEIDTSDIPELRDDFFKNAQIRWPASKEPHSKTFSHY